MAITFGGEFPLLLTGFDSNTIKAGNKLFFFNDGTNVPSGTDATFSVYDDAGNLLIDTQRLTDATDEELAGWNLGPVTLPYISNAISVDLRDDGSFNIYYTGSNPIIQRDQPAANPNFSANRDFAADGTPSPSEPGRGDHEFQSASPMPNGLIASSVIDTSDPSVTYIRVSVTDADGTESTFQFEPTGDSLVNILAPKPLSSAVLAAGEGVLVLYQDSVTHGVYMRRFTKDGVPMGGETPLSGTENVEWRTILNDRMNATTLPDGRTVVTYANQRDGIDTSPELFQAIFAPSGAILRGPEVVSEDLTGDGTEYAGKVFALSDGGHALVYHTIGGTPYRQEAVVRQFDTEGAPVTASMTFEDQTAGRSLNAFEAVIFPNGFGYMLDGLETEFTIQISGQVQSPDPAVNLTGSADADLLEGGNADDRLDGLAGNDTLRGGDGADTLIGGDGDDLILGGETEADLRDVVYAGAGDDSVDGGHGNDELYGMGGNDTMAGGFGVDRMIGGDGDDVLNGGAFSDQIFGGDGFDFINGGFGSDRLNGGAGADRFFHVGSAGHGSDWIQDYSAAEGDVLLYGGGPATARDFLVQIANTPGAGVAGVNEAFVTHIPSGNLLWALVDGDGQTSINIQLGGQVFDLLA